jgi:hypothetical protein
VTYLGIHWHSFRVPGDRVGTTWVRTRLPLQVSTLCTTVPDTFTLLVPGGYDVARCDSSKFNSELHLACWRLGPSLKLFRYCADLGAYCISTVTVQNRGIQTVTVPCMGTVPPSRFDRAVEARSAPPKELGSGAKVPTAAVRVQPASTRLVGSQP